MNNWTRGKPPANTTPPPSTTPGFHLVSIHQMAPRERTSDCSSLLIYRPRKDESHDSRLQAGDWQTWSILLSKFAAAPAVLSFAANARLGRQPVQWIRPVVDHGIHGPPRGPWLITLDAICALIQWRRQHQGAPRQMTWLEDPPSWLCPAYCFALLR